MRTSEKLFLAMVLLSFATGLLFYPYLPSLVASHWNAAGQVNGYLSRPWGAFGLPLLLIILFGVFFAIPRMDPKRENIARFRKQFDLFVGTFMVVFYYIYLLTLFWNLGYHFNFTNFLIPAIAIIFYVTGIVLPRTELNFTIGIRTPWTISSEVVWRETHRVGGIVFKISAVIMLLGILFPGLALWFILLPILVSIIGLVVYSYLLYEKARK